MTIKSILHRSGTAYDYRQVSGFSGVIISLFPLTATLTDATAISLTDERFTAINVCRSKARLLTHSNLEGAGRVKENRVKLEV